MSESDAPDDVSSEEDIPPSPEAASGESAGEESAAQGADSDAPAETSLPGRRNFLVEGVTGVLSFLLVAVPSAIAGIFYLDPILRKQGGDSESGDDGDLDGFIRLNVTRDVLPDDGTPVAVTVKATLDDAWNRFKNVPVGSVWLRKQPSGDIIAFNSVCPHLGCSVNYRRSEGDFYCPCHTSSFDLDGNKTNEVPPRNMDDLVVKTVSNGQLDENGSEIWLKFQNFKGGKVEKIPV